MAKNSNSWRVVRDAFLKQHFHDRDSEPASIRPFLYVGSYGAAMNRDALLQIGITHILCVSPSLPLLYPDSFCYLRLGIADQVTEKLDAYLPRAFSFIQSCQSEGGKLLVHCLAGRSRSIAIVVAYLTRVEGMPFEEALRLVKASRPQAAMNAGFLKQLK